MFKKLKITKDELIDAIHNIFNAKKDETFYVKNFGKIPQNLVSQVQ
ncbi:hypothetical protein PHO31112_03280 [Pandoraea horticolens]|uniref:Uncharacterized protein n=1 Tax=Pandoraea horticolens TaxID=2508298 RepID=A0A5E4WFR3_9BURK|nr:hypothetical protein PHO31112_03280 [Pandoraea horticolens]